MQRTLARVTAVVTAMTLLTAAAASADGVIPLPIEGSVRLAPIRAADPFGGPAHTFATYRSTLTIGGRTLPVQCIKSLRIDGHRLGTIDPVTGAFVPTTLKQSVADGMSDNCGGGLPMTWIAVPAGPGPTVTLDGGWFGPGITSVAIRDGGRWKPLPFTADGQFLVALPGGWAPEPNDPMGLPVLPTVRLTATLCGPHARRDLLNVGDTTRTGACALASYLPARHSPTARVQRQRARKHGR
ncbi:MAG TPA: hypothetical protein VGO48_06275 [Conexibacter sp.]|nr:hypothetical protein [Conexibacter sp.]